MSEDEQLLPQLDPDIQLLLAEKFENKNEEVFVVSSDKLREKLDTFFDVTQKMAEFPGPCNACGEKAQVRMCMTDVPNFGSIVIMVSECDECGFKDTEVKPGGAVSEFGKRLSLTVTSIDDLSRDLLKSDSAFMEIPEVELEMQAGTLGGKYTTVEGILDDIYDQLSKSSAFEVGDDDDDDDEGEEGSVPDNKFKAWLRKFKTLKTCRQPFTLIIDDPLGSVDSG
eukprot:TRINITY_DN5399_c1_g3_i2.p2 TRINITY_DN5399_c1_g3~~TRINITY_DN5399_c1_g3_i2.p2  ORF type:complete len:225 (+),score=79.28 TRINITY_DN5399_c1_g3_i2:495-1169(+)